MMLHELTMPVVAGSGPDLSPQSKQLLEKVLAGGYKSVTTELDLVEDEQIIRSMERTLGRDPEAIWIKVSPGTIKGFRPAGSVQTWSSEKKKEWSEPTRPEFSDQGSQMAAIGSSGLRGSSRKEGGAP